MNADCRHGVSGAMLAWAFALAAACGCSPKVADTGTEAPEAEAPPSASPTENPAPDPVAAEPAKPSLPPPDYETVDPLPEIPVLAILLESMGGSDVELRSAAVGSAATMGGEEVTTWLVGRMRGASPTARAAIVQALARRGDFGGLPTVLQATRDPDDSVRLAAIAGSAALGREMVAGALAEVLARGGDDAAAARKALIEMPGPEATAAVAQALEGTSAVVRRELLGVLAERDSAAHVELVLAAATDADESVRVAALKALGVLAGADALPRLTELVIASKTSRELRAAEKALSSTAAKIRDRGASARTVVAALDGSAGKARAALTRTLGRLGHAAGLPALRAALDGKDADSRDAAARSLSGWPDASVADDLLALAKNAPKETHRVLALRGYVRIAGLAGAESPEGAIDMYRTAARLADDLGRPEDKKFVLAGLAEVRHPAALEMMLPYLEDKALKAEAAVAIIKAAGGLVGEHPTEARAALRKVIAADVDADEKVKARAKEMLGGQAGGGG
jgi:HEAT repeat protein